MLRRHGECDLMAFPILEALSPSSMHLSVKFEGLVVEMVYQQCAGWRETVSEPVVSQSLVDTSSELDISKRLLVTGRQADRGGNN